MSKESIRNVMVLNNGASAKVGNAQGRWSTASLLKMCRHNVGEEAIEV